MHHPPERSTSTAVASVSPASGMGWLTRPRPVRELVWRPRLVDALDTGTRRTATLICAGPGWGKSALAASWAEARSISGPAAWLTLEAQHNDPYAFWSDVLLALQTAGAIPLGDLLPELGSAVLTGEEGFPRLVTRAMAQAPATAVLVLDNLHAVADPRVLRQLDRLLLGCPGRLRLVLITRDEPLVPLHRLRAAGELAEISAADLAFRLSEAAQLLMLGERRMPEDDLAALVRRTEGWAVGLRLMIDSRDEAGGVAAVEDYLVREVLDVLPEHVRTFLLRTSVPDRIRGELAEAVTGQRQGAGTLERLARAQLFLERSADGRWFRYHRMFRAALRHRLETTRPGTTPEVHLLAAHWYAAGGDALAALGHAAAAGDWRLLARLVVDHGLPLAASVDRAELFRIVRHIPAERLTHSPELVACAAILQYAYDHFEAIPPRIAQARRLLDGRHGGHALEVALSVLEATVTRRRGAMSDLVHEATDLLATLGRLRFDQVAALVQYRSMVLLDKGTALLWTGQLDHADSFLWAAATSAEVAGLPLVQIAARCHLALLAFLRGALRQAGEQATAGLDLAERIDGPELEATAAGHLTRSLIESEQGRDVEADDALRRACYALGAEPEKAHAVLAGLVRMRLLLDRGEPLAAGALVRALAAEIGPDPGAPVLLRMLAVARSEVELALGDAAAVVARYGRDTGHPQLGPPEQVVLAQAYLATRDQAGADETLERVREGSDRVSAVTAWILTALTADARGRTGRADEALARALALAEPEGIRRPFRRADARRLLTLTGRQQWLTDRRGPVGDSVLDEISGELPIILPPPSDSLSERETDVMRYLPTVLTAAEIAENLGISVNTVKAHMRAIYRKLGAARRREAVVAARQLGYL